MEFFPTYAVRDEMLRTMGLRSVEELFSDIPKSVRAKALNLPQGRSELEVVQYLRSILSANRPTSATPSFVGGTLKEHHIPAFVPHLLSRQEFYTAYTPYQAELSQGTLQALFEFQSLVSELVSMEVVNASMYDASTALAEAALMSRRVTGRSRILVPRHLAPEKRSTLGNYCKVQGIGVAEYGFDATSGESDAGSLEDKLGPDVAGIVVENPNFFGVWERRAKALVDAAHKAGALAIMGFDLTSLGIATPPGELGADIAYGDGTTLCFPPSLGGPQLGLFACREEHARKMPGRIIGATRDTNGNRAYCMTLQTREQHIRREKATSNICTNQALLAVGTGAHLAGLGPTGIRRLGLLNAEAARNLANRVEKETPWRRAFTGAFYNEVTLKGPLSGEEVFDRAGSRGLTPGYPASRAVPELKDALVVCSTELHTGEDHAKLVAALKGATR